MQGASDGALNFGLVSLLRLLISCLTPPNRYAMKEPQPDNEDAFADEEDAGLSRSDESTFVLAFYGLRLFCFLWLCIAKVFPVIDRQYPCKRHK